MQCGLYQEVETRPPPSPIHAPIFKIIMCNSARVRNLLVYLFEKGCLGLHKNFPILKFMQRIIHRIYLLFFGTYIYNTK